jgi:hypothetical protein
MTEKRNLEYLFLFGIGWSILAWIGCRGSSPEALLAGLNDSNLKRLANLYVRYQADHDWRGPEDEKSFRDYIESDVPDFLKQRIGFTSVDELFASERDQQPFKIRYKIVGSARGCFDPAIFEQTGRDGKRMVGFLNMVQKEVDEQEYNDLWAGEFVPPSQQPEG